MFDAGAVIEVNGSERPFGRTIDPLVFSGLEDLPVVLLAVSGGPDSMALLGLFAAWARTRPAPRIQAATVDHGLRPDAAAEAELVAAAAATLDVPHAILPWQGAKPRTRIQERARDARYALLLAHARQIGASVVMTAHHADDQAETVLMRLGRGSGVRGLGGMRREHALAPDVTLVRPLLAFPKHALEDECRRLGLAFVRDPSNTDTAFARARLRANVDVADSLGLTRDGLNRLARRMRRADEAIEAETSRIAALTKCAVQGGTWRADLSRQAEIATEIILRLLERAIAGVTTVQPDEFGTSWSGRPRLDRLEQLAADLHRARAAGRELRATLGGARVILARDGMVEVAPERQRRGGRPEAKKRRGMRETYPAALS